MFRSRGGGLNKREWSGGVFGDSAARIALQACCNIILEDTKAEWKPLHCVHFRISQDAPLATANPKHDEHLDDRDDDANILMIFLLCTANPKHDEHLDDRDDANADMDMVVREGLLAVRILVKILASSNLNMNSTMSKIFILFS